MNIGVSALTLDHLLMNIGVSAPAFDDLIVKPGFLQMEITAKSSPKTMKREIYQQKPLFFEGHPHQPQ